MPQPSVIILRRYVRPPSGRSVALSRRGLLPREHGPAVPLILSVADVPLGAPVFVAGGNIRRLVAAQDTGGAIRGPGRGDLFRGWGPEAGKRAGNLREPVRMWVLMPRANALVADGSR